MAVATSEANCGIVLDLHNIWTNARNGRQAVKDFLAGILAHRVWELHLAGGFEFDGYWLDAHSGAPADEVFDLAEDLIPALPNLKAVIFEVFPSFVPLLGADGIRAQIRRLERITHRAPKGKASAFRQHHKSGIDRRTVAADPIEWETTLGELVAFGSSRGRDAHKLVDDPALSLIRKLVWRFRAGALVKSLEFVLTTIRLHSGSAFLEFLLDDFFRAVPARPFASDEAHSFLAYIESRRLAVPYIDEAVAYDRCVIDAQVTQRAQYARVNHDPRDLLDALRRGTFQRRRPEGLTNSRSRHGRQLDACGVVRGRAAPKGRRAVLAGHAQYGEDGEDCGSAPIFAAARCRRRNTLAMSPPNPSILDTQGGAATGRDVGLAGPPQR